MTSAWDSVKSDETVAFFRLPMVLCHYTPCGAYLQGVYLQDILRRPE